MTRRLVQLRTWGWLLAILVSTLCILCPLEILAISGFPKMLSFKPSTTTSTGQAMHDNKGSKVTQEVSEQRTTRRSVISCALQGHGKPRRWDQEPRNQIIKLWDYITNVCGELPLQRIRLKVVDCPTQMTADHDLWQMTKNTAGSSGHWTTPVTFWLQLLFWDELTLSFFETSWLYKISSKLEQEISSIQFGSNAWSAHCSALDNMAMNKLQINRFEVEVESVLFPDFFAGKI